MKDHPGAIHLSEGLLLGGLIYGLLLLGLVTLNGGPLVLAIPLVVYLGMVLLYGPGRPQLRARRTLSSTRASPGVPVVVRLSIVNEGAHLEEVLVEDVVPWPLEVTDGEPRVMASLPSGGTMGLEYTVRGKRGSFGFHDVRVTVSDHLGLFRRQVRLPAVGQLTILPETWDLRRVAIRPPRTRAYAGQIPARHGGSGVEFFGVREYWSGDPHRWVNWRASARHPRTLFTNEFEQERIADVGLILDARQRVDIRSEGDALFEHAVRATASLAVAFLNEGNRVGLLIYGWFLDWTVPGYGKTQRERILQALAHARTGASMIYNSLDYLPTRFFPTRSQLVLVSPLRADDVPALVRLRARGYELMVVSPDPVSFELEGAGALEAEMSRPSVTLAARIARLERTLQLRKLRQAGIQIVDWPVDRPFDQIARASLSRPPRWLRALGVDR